MLRQYPAAFIVLLLIVVFEATYCLATEPLTGYPWIEPTPDDGTVAAKYALAKADRRYVIAFVGDSSCLRGVVPAEFSRVTGLASVNLCTHKMHSTAGYALIAARAVREHPELKAVVLVVTPETLGIGEAGILEFGSLGKHLVAYGDEGLGLSPGLRGYRQWFSSRHAFRSFPASFGGSYGRLVELLRETDGYLPEQPANTPVIINYPPDFKLAPWQERWIARLDRELERGGKKLLLALSPIPEEGSNPGYLHSAERSLEKLARSLENLQAIRPLPPRFPNIAFATPGHILPDWALKNTRDLATRAAGLLN